MLGAERFQSLRVRRKRQVWILIYVLLCAISIRSQIENGADDTSQDSGSQQTLTPGNDSPISAAGSASPETIPFNSSPPPSKLNDPSLPTASSDQSNPARPNDKDNNTQPDPNIENSPTLTASQTTATTTPPVRPPSNSQYRPPSKPVSSKEPGLSESAIGGIVFGSIVGVILLIILLVVYFRRLERSIARDKREYREKMARRYNSTREQNPRQFYLPETQLEPYEVWRNVDCGTPQISLDRVTGVTNIPKTKIQPSCFEWHTFFLVDFFKRFSRTIFYGSVT